jgi:putative flippase GtrA
VGAAQGTHRGERLISVGRLRRVGGEIARFSAVNVVATAAAVVIFNALVHGVSGWFNAPANGQPLPSFLVAHSIGMFISYYGSRNYAFKHRHAAGPGGGLVNYMAINFSSFVIPLGCLFVTRELLHWDSVYADNISGNVVGALLGSAFRFWAFRRFVFTKTPTGVSVQQIEPEATPQTDNV